MSTSMNMPAPSAVYRDRRKKLAKKLTCPLVIFAGCARARKYATNVQPFRASSNYLYFGGPPIEGAALLIEPGSDGSTGCVLYRARPDFDEIVWTGDSASDEEISQASGIDLASLAEVDLLSKTIGNRDATGLCPPCPITAQRMQSSGIKPAGPEVQQAIIQLRLVKDTHELIAMREAARVGVEAHIAAMHACAVGQREADVAAALMSVYTANECDTSFTPIVSVRGEILHSHVYSNRLKAGDLLLVDSGAELPSGYTSDFTRTLPVSGEFTPIQRQMYDTVLRAQQQAIAACLSGARYRDIHDLAARAICEGLVEAQCLQGNIDDLVTRRAHTLFFTHGLGHLIGLDVHDMEEFGDLAGYAQGRSRREPFGDKFLRLDRDLQAGYALTIEPGIYLVPALWANDELTGPFRDVVNRATVNALLSDNFGGIRIEEVIVVKESGKPEVLSEYLPRDADEVCALVSR